MNKSRKQQHFARLEQTVFLLFFSPFTKQPNKKFTKKGTVATKIINWDSSITEPSGWAVRVEVSTVREPVSTCKRAEEIIGARVDGGVSDDK